MSVSAPVYVWQPPTAEIAARAGIHPADVVRADQNTSPFTPPWLEEVAAAGAAGTNEYPSAEYRGLREAIAAHVGAEPEMIVPGAGADELIVLAARAWLGPSAVAAVESPAYAMHRIASLQAGATLLEVGRLAPALAFPTDDMAAAASSADLTWLCVPHNPVGDRAADSDVGRVLDAAKGMVVLDAAYAEFSGDRWGPTAASRPGLVVLGTLSKAFALAGARVGYAIAGPDAAEALDRLRPPGSVASVSEALALRALTEAGWMEEHVGRVVALREELSAGLAGLGYTPMPSQTNFVLSEVGPGAAAAAGRMMGRGVVVRSFPDEHPLREHLRFTVRRREQQERMLEALEQEAT